MKKLIFTFIFASVVFAGCDKEQKGPEEYGGFSFEFTEMTPSTVTVRVIPDRPDLMYLASYTPEDEYMPEGIQSFIDRLLAGVQKSYPTWTLEQIVTNLAYKGTMNLTFKYMEPTKGYRFYAVGIDAAGKTVTEDFWVQSVMPEAFGKVPEVSLKIRTGNDDGEKTSTYLAGEVETSEALYGCGYFNRKHVIDSLVEAGFDYERILKTSGLNFSQKELDRMNGGTMRYLFGPLSPATEYQFMMLVVGEGGLSAIAVQPCVTDAAAESAGAETGTSRVLWTPLCRTGVN